MANDSRGFRYISTFSNFHEFKSTTREVVYQSCHGRAVLFLEVSDLVLESRLGLSKDEMRIQRSLKGEISIECADEMEKSGKYFIKQFKMIDHDGNMITWPVS